MISLCFSLEDLVKVFSEVISERIDVNKTLNSIFKIVLKQVRVLIPQSKILQREYRKRELAVPFSFWFVFIPTKDITIVTI